MKGSWVVEVVEGASGPPGVPRVLRQAAVRATQELMDGYARAVEIQVRVLIRPRPWWLPGGAWRWLVSKVLRVQWGDAGLHLVHPDGTREPLSEPPEPR